MSPAHVIHLIEHSQVVYRIEQSRGYAHEGSLWSPGFFHVDLEERDSVTLVGSTEKWEIVEVLAPTETLVAERARRRSE